MTNDHIEATTLAAFAEGRLERREIPEVTAHLDRCRDCRDALQAANDVIEDAPQQRTRTLPAWWLAAAAMLAMVFVAVPSVRMWRARTPMRELVQVAPRAARVAEPRLTGGFAWAAYRGPVRGEELDRERLKVTAAAAKVIDRAEQEQSAAAQREAGVAYVLIDQPDDAIRTLRAAAERDPSNAHTWSDLAAAQVAAAQRAGNASLYPEALASVQRALRADPRLPEARFNHAVILERLGLARDARAAWQHYLEVDPSSPWADEARQRLAKIPETTGESLFKDELPQLERDVTRAAEIVAKFPQQARTYAEAEHLGRWGEAVQRGDANEAARMLSLARAIGDALAARSGETLLRDAVRAIDRSDAKLAEAHVLYRRGRIAYARREPSAAESSLREAATRFAAAGSPMALVARYFAASTRFDQNDVRGAREELDALRSQADAAPGYAALGAQIRWQLALCHTIDADWTSTHATLVEAERTFRRLGERSNEGFIQSLLAQTFVALGRPDDAWAARIRAFELLSAEGRGDRLPAALLNAGVADLVAGRRDTAAALFALAENAARATSNDLLLADALVRRAVLDEQRGDHEAAAAAAREASIVAARMPDANVRERAQNDVRFATAAVALQSDPRGAAAMLKQAIDAYVAYGAPLFLPESHLLRARASLRLGDRAEAARDLERGIALMERQPIAFADNVVGTGVLDAGVALFEDAIRLTLDRGDVATAFAYSERARGQRVTLQTLQQRLAGSGAAVLSFSVLAEELVAFAITSDDVRVSRSRALVTKDERELYELLIRPHEAMLARATSLILVPDRSLAAVPFAALYDARAKRHLIEMLPIAIAPSSGGLQPGGRAPIARALAVTLPSGAAVGSRALAAEEVAELRTIYGDTTELAQATFDAFVKATPGADVIHVAGHTERQPGLGEPALVFAPRERVSWTRIAATRLGKPRVVVLAACETLRAPHSRQSRALSLGDAFLAAGAADVIGTLTPIADADARELFLAVHRQLAAGVAPAEAVRRVQVGALAAGGTAWRSIALLTSQIPTKED